MRRYWILTTILMFLLCGCSKGDDIPDVVEVGGQFAEETDTTMEQCLEYEYDDHETISEQTSELYDDEFQEKLSKALENKYAWKDEDSSLQEDQSPKKSGEIPIQGQRSIFYLCIVSGIQGL